MSNAMTKSEIIAGIAESAGITKEQASTALDSLVQMAYKGAGEGFTVPGLGKLVKVQRSARTGRNPATGEPIQIPAKTAVKFRVAKAAKDAIVG